VAYAMILAELLQSLIREGVALVISSNTKPDDLYAKGVHRERFLPAIALIKQECVVMHLNEPRDYRLGRQPLLDAYLYPLNEQTEEKMQEQFTQLVPVIEMNSQITIQSRIIPCLKLGLRSIWFEFSVLCNFPRSQLDYLEIADRFEHVFVSGVPSLTVNHTAQTIMFIHFIDVMYDRGIKVIISAEVPMDELYLSGEMLDAFKRTLSRLNEMQSVDYLNRHPRRVIQDIL
jgi:cell division protein ZapE